MTWSGFVKMFFGKYILDCARDKEVMEFIELKHNNLTMDQYDVKFAKLPRFTPILVWDKEDMAKRFQDGQRLDTESRLVPLNLENYNDLYECAQPIERNFSELATAATFTTRPNHTVF